MQSSVSTWQHAPVYEWLCATLHVHRVAHVYHILQPLEPLVNRHTLDDDGAVLRSANGHEVSAVAGYCELLERRLYGHCGVGRSVSPAHKPAHARGNASERYQPYAYQEHGHQQLYQRHALACSRA